MVAAELESLAEIEAAVWRELAAAAGDKAHPWRCAVLATRADEGADARTVVLREVDAARRELLIYTDARSPKAAQIAAHPRGTLVMWSAARAWQLRVTVDLGLETSGLAVSSRWARLKLTPAALDYLSPLPPGTRVDAVPKPERTSREHFALLVAQVVQMDWLELAESGQRRAAFGPGGARWLVP
jgi:hypothetical protein